MEQDLKKPFDLCRGRLTMSIINIRRDGRMKLKCKVCGHERADTVDFYRNKMYCENGCVI